MSTQPDNHEPTTVSDLSDRLVERALAEVVGGETPPDLSELILAGKRPSAHVMEERVTRRRLSRRAWLTLAVAAMLLIAAVPLLWPALRGTQRELATFNMPPDSQTPYFLSETNRLPEPGPGIVGPGPGIISGTLPPPTGSPGQPPSESQTMPGPQTPGARSTLESLNAEGLLGPVDVRFIEGANIVIARGREQDVQQVVDRIKAIEDASNQAAKPFENGQQSAVAWNKTPTGVSDFPRFTSDLDVARPNKSLESAGYKIATRSNGDDVGYVVPGLPANVDALSLFDTANAPNGTVAVSTDKPKELPAKNFGDLERIARYYYVEPAELNAGRDVKSFDGVARPQAETKLGTGPGLSGDQYVRIFENPFIKAVGGAAVSTFSIDVDTASYTNVRRFLLAENTLPPPDAVRLEELVNYFKYDYAPPAKLKADNVATDAKGSANKPAPFAAHIEVAGCPWKPEHRLVRIGIKGQEMDGRERPKSNLVFLVDVSGSMDEPNKLPLVVDSLKELARELGENDRVAIVVYAQQEGLVLGSTPGSQRETILGVLNKLRAGGSTAGGAGIQLAYQIAEDNFIQGGTNRVILCTDGDFNVGVTSTAELQRMVEQKAKDTKVFLSVLGFGRGNLNDQMMEAISNRGNGNYSYVDSLREARRVFVEEMSGTLVTIAKDVKIQVEFNPQQVAGYRLLGYENRMLRTEDFNDDKKDAGEIGAGHTVTALYEIVLVGKPIDLPPVDALKYQQPTVAANQSQPNAEQDAANNARELLTLKMKYKRPDADTSEDTLKWPVTDDGKAFSAASPDFQFASAVAGFGMLLRGSEHKGNLTYAAALELAQGGVGKDEHGYRAEFLSMIRQAKQLRGE